MRFLILTAAILVTLSAPALAEGQSKIMQCGVPEKPDTALTTEPVLDFCDIYARQLAYPDTQKEFRKLIDERRKNYVQARNEAYNAYKKKLDSRYQ